MADTPIIPMGDDPQSSPAAARYAPDSPQGAEASRLWQRGRGLSSAVADRAEQFLTETGFDRAPWLAVAFACGILAWFSLKSPWQWMGALGLSGLVALAALAAWPRGGRA
ncbi:MAG: metal-binding protein, partial [Pseudomonadota bacterium]